MPSSCAFVCLLLFRLLLLLLLQHNCLLLLLLQHNCLLLLLLFLEILESERGNIHWLRVFRINIIWMTSNHEVNRHFSFFLFLFFLFFLFSFFFSFFFFLFGHVIILLLKSGTLYSRLCCSIQVQYMIRSPSALFVFLPVCLSLSLSVCLPPPPPPPPPPQCAPSCLCSSRRCARSCHKQTKCLSRTHGSVEIGWRRITFPQSFESVA